MASNDTAALKLHLQKLAKYCRVCSKVLQLKETAHSCNANAELLLKIFNIDTKTDSTNVHPRTYCHKCHTTAKKMASGEDGTATSLSLHDLQCKLCGALAPDISSEHRTATTYSEATQDGLAPHFHGFILTK
ncbi:hypothetical protein GBAR_LOCUS30268 [Geodia barretti]|uniref:RAG1 importin-binding domain-containing protein n=1 Tax=Geodia barretti TaxID=519541 RepID=A0AA35XK01_GEOBA|nr:hypothetical protein GBAR_LOCUS30268 [Geodia barretti]